MDASLLLDIIKSMSIEISNILLVNGEDNTLHWISLVSERALLPTVVILPPLLAAEKGYEH